MTVLPADLQGCIERVTADTVSGWLVDRARVTARPRLRLSVDGVAIAEGSADRLRPDLLRNHVGDGRHGFHLAPVDGSPDLARAFLDGRLMVETCGEGAAPFRLGPSPTLGQETLDSVMSRSLDTLSFEAFLQEMAAAAQALPPAEVTRMLFPLVNAGRAHFPEWRRSQAFLELAAEVALVAGRPLSEAYYRRRLEDGEGPRPEAAARPAPGSPVRCYGSLADLLEDPARPAIRLRRASMFRVPSPPCFLEEIGFFPEPEGPAVPVLAFREYAFGDASWHVLREGRRRDVARSLYYLDFEQLLQTMADGGILCIDMSNEGPVYSEPWNRILNAAIDDIGLDRARILYVTQNLAYRTAAGDRDFFGTIAHAHFFIGAGLRALLPEFAAPGRAERHLRDILLARRACPEAELRHYACLNFTPRMHRWLMALFLLERGHLDRGFVSFPGARHPKMPHTEDIARNAPMVRLRDRLVPRVPQLLSMCPLVLDVAPDAPDTPTDVYPLDLMRRSLLHIVTESEVGGPGIRRITEKILKPIVGLQPFVVMGNAGSLDILRAMGFRSFAPVLREDYDDIADPAARIDAVFDEVDRLVSMPIGALRDTLAALDEVVIHNLLHLVDRGPLLFGAAGEARLRRAVGAMVAGRAGASGQAGG